MDENRPELEEAVKSYSTKSYSELETAKKGAAVIARILKWVGIGTLFCMMMWPGWLLIPFGIIAVYLFSNIAVSVDDIAFAVDKNLEKFGS